MSKIALVARVVLGLIFFVFGLNGFLNFLPAPQPPEGAATAYMTGLFQTGYFFPVLKLTEVVAGAMLLAGAFVPLALVLLAPIVVHIALYHLALDVGAQQTGMAVVILVLQIVLAWAYREHFRGVLDRTAKPAG